MQINVMMEQTPVYIKEVGIEDYKCFKGKHDFSFVEENGDWCRWTVFLGDNNSGKTNLLKAIAAMEPVYVPAEDAIGRFPRNRLKSKAKASISMSFIGPEEHVLYVFIDDYVVPIKGYPPILRGEEVQPIIYAYGVVREIEKKGIATEAIKYSNTDNLFENTKLINSEDWLAQLDYAAKNNSSKENKKRATKRKTLVVDVLTGEVFPDINKIRFYTDEDLNNRVEFQIEDGWYRQNELGYGYQSMLSWMVDFCKNMFDRYPNSEDPLKEPAVLLVDEIDLHVHPHWQRNIVKYLSNIFTQTQFIVTTHSPFVIQSMERVNLYTLQREGDHTKVKHLGCRSYVGWRIEEILSEVMGLEDNIQTDIYQTLMKQFETALNNEDYNKGKEAYDKLMLILHPQSVERKLLDIQMSQLIPDDKA